jgi:hypothetical protein
MAEGQENLNQAIVEKLRADTVATIGLVALTGHDQSKAEGFRIARQTPPVKSRLPFLGVSIFTSIPLMDSDVSQLQRARVHFRCYGAKELPAIKLADRMEHLLHGRAEDVSVGTNRGYYDFSNSEVSTRSTRFKNRDLPDFDDDVDAWNVLVEADLVWIDEPGCTQP